MRNRKRFVVRGTVGDFSANSRSNQPFFSRVPRELFTSVSSMSLFGSYVASHACLGASTFIAVASPLQARFGCLHSRSGSTVGSRTSLVPTGSTAYKYGHYSLHVTIEEYTTLLVSRGRAAIMRLSHLPCCPPPLAACYTSLQHRTGVSQPSAPSPCSTGLASRVAKPVRRGRRSPPPCTRSPLRSP
jgi:hypothetical protein